jgi:hypothetical protein
MILIPFCQQALFPFYLLASLLSCQLVSIPFSPVTLPPFSQLALPLSCHFSLYLFSLQVLLLSCLFAMNPSFDQFLQAFYLSSLELLAYLLNPQV